MLRLALYYYTIRHLRPVQVYGRLLFRLRRPRPMRGSTPGLRQQAREWIGGCKRRQSMRGVDRFAFLNIESSVESSEGWNRSDLGKLWLYNLHYFDDLNAVGAQSRRAWHEALLARWIADNPPGVGVGWEPYPTSLRIVNWIKWALVDNTLAPIVVESLAVQARYLSRRLETHLLGNHLLANAKALVFAGMFFEGPEADAWLATGIGILEREIGEQILADGGHFERSPMYHALVLEDLLDLENLLNAYGHSTSASWHETLGAMRNWLRPMVHPDGDIAFFNDAAFGIACSPGALEAYARRLGLPMVSIDRGAVVYLPESGYVRLQSDPAYLVLDVAPVGPDYLPAHAHADTLSFELSLFGGRALVNSGTSLYEVGTERDRQRGTAAHNTVVIDGENSSEVWAGFRVARRARVLDVDVQGSHALRVRAAHDGYRRLPGRPIHRREWLLDDSSLTVIDRIEGSGRHQVEVIYHTHPSVEASYRGDGVYELRHAQWAKSLSVKLEGPVSCAVERGTYHPEFGVAIDNQRLCATYRGSLPVEIRTLLRW